MGKCLSLRFFLVFFGDCVMKQAHRFFNLLLPYSQYEELKNLSIKPEKSVAQIIREGIDIVLNKECKLSMDDTDGWF